MTKEKAIVDFLQTKKLRLLYWPAWKIKNSEDAKLLSQNYIFKNKYRGKRCFIFGNGPSIKSIDFSRFANEIVFTVNQLARNDHYNELNSNFHFWADPVFFKLDKSKPEDAELLNTMLSVNTGDNRPAVFVPIEQREFCKKNNLDNELELYFYKMAYIPCEYWGDIDYTKIVPGFHAVVQFCITMAIYMGFTEIYLLGCNNTSIIATIQSLMSDNVTDYGYTVTDNERQRIQNVIKNESLYSFAYSFAENLKGYSNLFEYCQRRGITLRNCTEKSAIDSIPYISIDEIM